MSSHKLSLPPRLIAVPPLFLDAFFTTPTLISSLSPRCFRRFYSVLSPHPAHPSPSPPPVLQQQPTTRRKHPKCFLLFQYHPRWSTDIRHVGHWKVCTFFPPLAQPSRVDSSDLWVTGSVPGAQDTGTSLTLSYAIGNAAGVSCLHFSHTAFSLHLLR